MAIRVHPHGTRFGSDNTQMVGVPDRTPRDPEAAVTPNPPLHHPRLLAVWPGMGHVAVNAGIYLLSKLEMTLLAEFDTTELFDAEGVEVKNGLIRATRRPRSRVFLWSDPNQANDLLVFLDG